MAARVPGQGWVRATVLGPGEADSVVLYLPDLGRETSLPSPALRPLPTLALRLPGLTLALALALSGVLPAGGGGWTRSACELAEALAGHREVEVRVEGPSLAPGLLPCYPASVWLVDQEPAGPLEPAVTVRRCLAAVLQEAGLALPSRGAGSGRQTTGEVTVAAVTAGEETVAAGNRPDTWLPAAAPTETTFQAKCWWAPSLSSPALPRPQARGLGRCPDRLHRPPARDGPSPPQAGRIRGAGRVRRVGGRARGLEGR